jgi:hypothetical protein
MRYVCFCLLLLAFKGHAQYPFEKFPVKKYDSVKFKIIDVDDNHQMGVAQYENYTVKITETTELTDGGKISIYFKGKLIKSVNGDFIRVGAVYFPLYLEDIDDDGIPDFIIQCYSAGASGLASSHVYNTCFLKRGSQKFKVLRFESFYQHPQREYEFKPGKYAIIGQSLLYYKGHNYWLFDLYHYKNGKLVNVSKQYNYPIAVPYLNKETFTPTTKISRRELERLSSKEPDFSLATP